MNICERTSKASRVKRTMAMSWFTLPNGKPASTTQAYVILTSGAICQSSKYQPSSSAPRKQIHFGSRPQTSLNGSRQKRELKRLRNPPIFFRLNIRKKFLILCNHFLDETLTVYKTVRV